MIVTFLYAKGENMITAKDKNILHELALRVAEIAALPIQEEKRRLWRKLNALKPERPMVRIDQIFCWNEMEDDELTQRCEDEECRAYEQELRRTLYEWKHFPVDKPVESVVKVNKAIENSSYGVVTLFTSNDREKIQSHSFINQFESMEDVEKIKMPVVTHDRAETDRRMAVAEELFGGILEIWPEGLIPWFPMWDKISLWMGVENALYALIDQPDIMHAMCKRMVAHYMSLTDQLEEQGLFCSRQFQVHCTGAYTDDLPAPGYDPEKVRAKDLWAFGLAQMFSTVSPAMFDEYEIEYMLPVFERYGLMYYGCCDPLDGKMKEVRRIPNLRKISMSPWANHRRGAEEIGKDYVFSSKPNPSYLAMPVFNGDMIRKELTSIRELCRDNGCPVEFILKDLCTVGRRPERLREWGRIAMEVSEGW